MAKMLDIYHVKTNTNKVEDLNNKLCKVYDRTGLNGLKEHVTSELNKWKDVKVTIAVTGNSGAGKSSLINALQGLDQSDENAAEEGVTETTKERHAYPFPSNEKVILYDLPGAGTKTNPMDSYTSKIDFEQYHFVVIVSKGRFMENDAVIVEELKRLNKPFFLVRSNIGYDVNNRNRRKQTEYEVKEMIRNDCLSHLEELGVKGTNVFLVDSHNHQAFELGKLQMCIAKNAPEEALKASLVFTYRNMTKEVIEGKIQFLKDRAMMVAVKAVASAVPGVRYLMDTDVIIDEVTFYKEELGLDDESLVNTSKILGLEFTEIKNMISFTDPGSLKKSIVKMYSGMNGEINVQQTGLEIFLIYIVSTIAAFGISCGKVHNTLGKILETFHLEALEICERILETKRQ